MTLKTSDCLVQDPGDWLQVQERCTETVRLDMVQGNVACCRRLGRVEQELLRPYQREDHAMAIHKRARASLTC